MERAFPSLATSTRHPGPTRAPTLPLNLTRTLAPLRNLTRTLALTLILSLMLTLSIT